MIREGEFPFLTMLCDDIDAFVWEIVNVLV